MAMASRVRILSRSASKPGGQGVADGAGVRDRAGEPVELGYDQDVPSTYRGQGLVEAGLG
jgi:hypothetical protein